MTEQITQEQEEEISPKKTIDTMTFDELKAYTKKKKIYYLKKKQLTA